MDFVEIGRDVLAKEIEGIHAVREALGASFQQTILCLLQCQGTIICMGIGKSGIVAKKMSATLCSMGIPSIFLHPVEAIHGDIGVVREYDVIVVFSNSGETSELHAALHELMKRKCQIIAVTGGANSPLSNVANHTILVRVPYEACSLVALPTSSTTAALAISDALAVCLFRAKGIDHRDFLHFHPGGSLGVRFSQTLGEVMTVTGLPLVDKDKKMGEALVIMEEGKLGTLFVVDGKGRLNGIVTDGDIRRQLVQGRLSLDKSVSEIMTSDPVKISRHIKVADAIEVMELNSITILPVIDETETLIGVVHIHDLLGRGKFNISNCTSKTSR